MPSVTANGITIEYETIGSGEPLLLIMGLGGQLIDWPSEFVERLAAQGFAVTVYDNRDSGFSTEFDWDPPTQMRSIVGALTGRPPPAGYLLADMASDAAGLLRALDIDSAHVVGMSMGGMIAQQLAIDHPRCVRSLTSIMSNTGNRQTGQPSKKILTTMARTPRPTRDTAVEYSLIGARLFCGPHFDEDEARRLLSIAIERSYRPLGVARQTAAIFASPDREPRLGGVQAPTLVVHGLVDALVRPSGGIATARSIPGSRLVMYPDMGHDLPRPRWDEMIAEITDNAARA